MFLSKEDSTQLWDAVVSHDFSRFNPISQKLLNPQGVGLRHLPVRLYLPHRGEDGDGEVGRVRVVQKLVPVSAAGSSTSSFSLSWFGRGTLMMCMSADEGEQDSRRRLERR